MEEFDTEWTDKPLCPYCGKEQCTDDGEVRGQVTCSHCDKNFECEPSYDVSYTTWKVPCLNGEPHNWKEVLGIELSQKDKKPFHCRTCNRHDWREQ